MRGCGREAYPGYRCAHPGYALRRALRRLALVLGEDEIDAAPHQGVHGGVHHGRQDFNSRHLSTGKYSVTLFLPA